ncbi:fumarylacetoacetate hydrolase family protein [Sporosarcina limicola]|uniref:5-oxopent-3-ene-1,2,5-tricarboxylate decarboxylase/2-hydroxyhepta-2,4-diene-1,7-dioate isomerase n=1 Tax=Sporosarcina limicola TaxID=34101 RepID=A0A927MLL3_9BACL|nr:fumarylacetoacetate hydrolase family protein [Sporosarcina limicola]MBE1555177.1 5-oxopent-3-ene-1,2,5-tricarboxylate decarboxylase/2-hydroxyhepta-2,4-diene-1,7-dioate isomerase [Sporosarcina limicola]
MSKAKIKVLGVHELVTVDVNTETNTVVLEGSELSANKIQLDSPITGTVFGTLLNYRGALEGLGETVNEKPYSAPPIAPILYIKPANTFNRNGGAIPMPEGLVALEIGAALGIVIGKQASRVSEEAALDYVAGYTVVNDVSVPHESVYRPAVQHKSRDGFCPVGPWIVDRDAVANPDNLAVRVFINDELRQENTTSNLIRPVSQLLANVTDYMTLSAGDVLLVGIPEEAPHAKTGDNVRVEIEGIGSLENSIVDEKEREWGKQNENSTGSLWRFYS